MILEGGSFRKEYGEREELADYLGLDVLSPAGSLGVEPLVRGCPCLRTAKI